MVRAQYSISCPDGTTAVSITGCEGTLTRVLRNAPEGTCNTDFTIWVANAGAASEVGNAILSGDFIAKTLTVETDIVLPTGAIGTDDIADGTITRDDIADDTLTSSQIGSDAIDTSELANNAVTTAKIANDAVTSDKLAHSISIVDNLNVGRNVVVGERLTANDIVSENTATIRGNAAVGGRLIALTDMDVGQDLKVTRNARIEGRALFSKRVSMKGHAYGTGTGSAYWGETQPGVDWSDGNFDGNFHYYTKGNNGNDDNIWNNQFGLVLSHNVLAQTYHARSDERIKTDIEPVPDHLALDTIRRLDSKYYHYKDTVKFGRNRTIGFIAQEVLDAIPEAVSREIEVIPNEMRKTNPTWRARADGTFDMQIDGLTGPGVYRFFMSFNRPKLLAKKPTIYNETEHDLTTTDGKTFTTDQKYDNVFLYGKEVDDFLTIDKNKIFAVAYAALQEVDRIQQVLQEKVATLEETVSTLSERLAALKK